MSAQKNKQRIGIVYSTDPDYQYDNLSDAQPDTLPTTEQMLKISLDKKARAGKQVTLISGFVGKEEDLIALAKTIKTRCSVGGSVKDGEIIIQGDVRKKIEALLIQMQYRCKTS